MGGVNAASAALGAYSEIPKIKNIYELMLEANINRISDM